MLGLIKKCLHNLKRWIFLSITLLGLGFANNLALAASLVKLPQINAIDRYGELNGKLYFHGYFNDGGSGGLWVTDGSISGTQLLTENLTAVSPYEDDFFAFDGKLYFTADDGVHGVEVWVLDVSSGSTHLLKDINIQPLGNSFPYGFTELGGKLYFVANDNVQGWQLWVTDGSSAGTVPVHDGISGYLTAFNGSLYYSAANGMEYGLWRMDSSTNEKQVLPTPNEYQALPSLTKVNLVPLNNKLYFPAGNNSSVYGIYGGSLWETDGTISGTQKVASTNSILSRLTELNGKLYFIGHDGSRGSLWETNGTASGTKLIEDSVYVLPHLVRFRNRLLFMDYDGSDGRNLWSTDGSNSGTQLLLDIIASHGTLNRDSFGRGVLKNKFYFTVLEPTYGREVWETDGSENGTRLVKDLSADSIGSDIVTTFAGKVVISSYDEHYVGSIWILTPLTLTTTSPTAGESDVPLNTSHLTLSFNEPVSAGSGNIKIIKSSDHTVVASYSIADLTPDGVVINGTNVTIPLRAGLLEPKTSYYVTINAGVFIGGESEPYPAITDANTWSFTTAKGTQGITFATDTPTTKTLTDLPFAVTATGGNSGQPVLITSSTPQVCNIISGKVELLSTGTCTLTANQAGNEQYHAAASVNFEITVTAATKTDQVISFDPQTPTSKTLGDEPFAVLATGGASGNPVVITSSTSNVCTIFNTTVTLVSVGTCTLTANQLGNTNYNAALPVSMNISVTAATKTDQVISFDPQTPTSKTLGDEPFAVLATGGASGNPVVITSSTSNVCSITNNTVTVLNVGICALTANQAGNATYNPAVPVNKDITVSAVTQGSVGDIRLTINKGHLVDLKLETISSYVIGRPNDMHFIEAYSYRIIGLSTTQVETVTITLTFNSSIPSGAKLYKVTSNGYKEITEVAINNNAATFSITDGNSFDADGFHNGIIIDPIALGIPPTTVVKID